MHRCYFIRHAAAGSVPGLSDDCSGHGSNCLSCHHRGGGRGQCGSNRRYACLPYRCRLHAHSVACYSHHDLHWHGHHIPFGRGVAVGCLYASHSFCLHRCHIVVNAAGLSDSLMAPLAHCFAVADSPRPCFRLHHGDTFTLPATAVLLAESQSYPQVLS
jgi:hypothetical protein